MMNKWSEWKGSQDPDLKSGTAKFNINGGSIELDLNNFKEFSSIDNLLQLAYNLGYNNAIEDAKNKLKEIKVK